MDKIVVYGTGNTAKIFFDNKEGVEICCVVDGDVNKVGKRFYGHIVLDAASMEWFNIGVDRILICSNYYDEILRSGIFNSVSKDKIVIVSFDDPCFDDVRDFYFSPLFNYLNERGRKRLEEKIEEKKIGRLMGEIERLLLDKTYDIENYPLSVYEDDYDHLDNIGTLIFQTLFRNSHFEIIMKNCFGYMNYVDSGYESRFIFKYCFPADCYPIICFLKKYGISGEDVFDVGANRGMMSLFLATIAEKVHCFEPSHEVSKYAKRNIAINGFENIIWNECGVGDENTFLNYYDYGIECSGHNSFIVQNSGEALKKESVVEVITLESYCKKNKVDRIDILKIDVEGFEAKVINGLGGLLRDGKVGMIIFEVSPSLEFDREENRSVISSLFDKGFRFFDLHANEISLEVICGLDKHMDVVAVHDTRFLKWGIKQA